MRLRVTVHKDGEVLGAGSYSKERIPRVKIGSAEKMHLRVEEPGIADEHVHLFIQSGKAFACPSGEATVLLNGEAIQGEVRVGDADRLKIGEDMEFTLEVIKKKRKEPESIGPKSGRISFNKFIDVAGTTEDGRDPELPVEKLKKKPDPEDEEAQPKPKRRFRDLRALSIFDIVKIVAILIMVIVLFGMVIIPTIQKLMVS